MRSASVLCLLSSLTCSLAAQYATDFESLAASATGTAIAGQDGYYVPTAGGNSGSVYTYAGNALGIAPNPNGAAQFYVGQSVGGTFARSQRTITLPSGAVHIGFDVLCNYAGTATPTNNIGSFSFQDSMTSTYVNLLARWPTGVTFPPTTWNADYVLGPTATGTQSVLPDPAFQNLDVGVWHRWEVTADLVAGVYLDFTITNGTTGVTTTYTPSPPAALPGQGTAQPTDFRLFTGGNENVFAIDNLIIDYAATYTTFGAGCPGALGVPTLAAAPGSKPVLGSLFTVDLGNLPVGAGLMISGLSNTLFGGGVPLPLPLAGLGFPGCDLLVDAVIIDFVVGPAPNASWVLAIPATSSLAGATIYNQGASLDTGPAFLAFSNGGCATLGY